MRWIRTFAVIAAVVIAVLAGLVVLLFTADLRGIVEKAVTEATGRRFTIAGALDLQVAMPPRVVAEDVMLGNPQGAAEQTMVRVERLELSVDVGSIFRGPLRIVDCKARGLAVRLEEYPDGSANWQFKSATPSDGAREGEGLPVLFDTVSLADVEVTYRPTSSQKLAARLGSVRARQAATGLVELAVSGQLNGRPLAVEGAFGPLQNLVTRGRVRNELRGSVGGLQFSLNGSIEDFEPLSGVNQSLRMAGVDVAALMQSLGLSPIANGNYVAAVQIGDAAAGAMFEVDALLGDIALSIEGKLDALTDPSEWEMGFGLSGPNLAAVASLAELEGIAAVPFRASGHVAFRDGRFEFDGAKASAGGDQLSVHGSLGPAPTWLGTDLHVSAVGRDLSRWTAPFGLERLAAGPFDVRAHALVDAEQRLEIREAKARIGANRVEVHGSLGTLPGLEGLDLRLGARGPSLAALRVLAGMKTLPAAPFRVRGRVQRVASLYRLRRVAGRIGNMRFKVTGTVPARSDLVGTALSIEAAGESFAALAALAGVQKAPHDKFRVTGHVRRQRRGYKLRGVALEVGKSKLSLDGRVRVGRGLVGTELRFDVAGPNFAALAKPAGVPQAPAAPFSASGRFAITASGYRFDAMQARLGAARATLQGFVGGLPKLRGTDLAVDAAGPDLSTIVAMFGRKAPAEPFGFTGAVRRVKTGLLLDDLKGKVGPFTLQADGTLGDGPTRAGTDLRLSAAGPSLAMLSSMLDGPSLPGVPFRVVGRFAGTPSDFQVQEFEAHVGQADLSGSVTVDLRGKPKVTGHLASDRLDLSPLLSDDNKAKGTDAQAAKSNASKSNAPKSNTPQPGALVFGVRALSLDWLSAFDGVIDYSATQLTLPGLTLRNLALRAELRDGRLTVVPLIRKDAREATLTPSFRLQRLADGFAVALRVQAHGLRIGTVEGKEDSATGAPPIDLDVAIRGRGSSPHAIAANAKGVLRVFVGSGRLDTKAVNLAFRGVARQLLSALNPAKEEQPYTPLACSAAVVDIKDGIATAQSLVGQMEKTTFVGQGSVDLKTEEIDLTWTTHSRRLFTLSLQGGVQSFVKLGGTLADPALEFAPGRTGAALATVGLSIVAQRIRDRAEAGKDVCKTARSATGLVSKP